MRIVIETYTRALTVIIFSLLWLAGCDNFSLPAQFEYTGELELVMQKRSVEPGETIELYPNGGVAPYTYGIVAESLFYDSTLGSITDHRYTAGDSIGDVRIYLFDQDDNSISDVITTLPPPPGTFNVNPSSSDPKAIDLDWSYSDPNLISTFRIYRSVDGGAFEPLDPSPMIINTQTHYTDSGLNPTLEYSYRLCAVADEYVSKTTENKNSFPSPP